MTEHRYRHVVEYDERARKIVVTRVFDSGESHLFTEFPIDRVTPPSAKFEALGRMLGEALILDTPGLRDEV
ncbi:MAG TPA: hypothetical protein VFB45_10215 [Pseudolabrys sp.]|nr:hypothetical protein [Pseudolabrys sp.]